MSLGGRLVKGRPDQHSRFMHLPIYQRREWEHMAESINRRLVIAGAVVAALIIAVLLFALLSTSNGDPTPPDGSAISPTTTIDPTAIVDPTDTTTPTVATDPGAPAGPGDLQSSLDTLGVDTTPSGRVEPGSSPG